MIAGAPLRNEDLRGYETHSQSELVVHEDGTCVVDGVPTDFVSMLRDKVRPHSSALSIVNALRISGVSWPRIHSWSVMFRAPCSRLNLLAHPRNHDSGLPLFSPMLLG